MARLLSIILILLLASPAWAFPPLIAGKTASGGAAACTAPSGDELSNGFTVNTGWTAVTLVEDTNLFYNHVLQAGDPTGSCGTGVLFTLSSGVNRERIYWNRGSVIDDATTIDIKFSIYFNEFNLADGNNIPIVGWSNSNEGALNYVRLSRSGANYTLRGVSGASASTAAIISATTWYTVTLHLDATAASSYFQIAEVETCDAASECTFTRSTTDAQYLVIGKNAATAEYPSFEMGYITVNTP